jgi:hypothetical protein
LLVDSTRELSLREKWGICRVMSSPTFYLRDICAKVPRGWVQADAQVMQYKLIGQVEATSIGDFLAFVIWIHNVEF